jgi:hypothetical protein
VTPAEWAEGWKDKAARRPGGLEAHVRRLVAEWRPRAVDAAEVLRWGRLALFGTGRMQWFKGIAGDTHPVALLMAAVNEAQCGQYEAGAELCRTALERLLAREAKRTTSEPQKQPENYFSDPPRLFPGSRRYLPSDAGHAPAREGSRGHEEQERGK